MSNKKDNKKLISNNFKKYKFNFHTKSNYIFKTPRGLNKKIIQTISNRKNEPKWMLNYRLEAFEIFQKKPFPTWGEDLSKIDFNKIYYYLQTQNEIKTNWKETTKEIQNTFQKIGIPKAEKDFLGGTGIQFESEVIYHSLKKNLQKKGVIFESIESGLKKYPKLFKKYFGTVISASDNKFSALNSAVWSGGSFIYIPKNTHIKLPLHAYFRMNEKNMGQFERTLIIADENSSVEYIEGCTAPIHKSKSLHSAVVEIIINKNAKVKYTTIQNWSNNIYNLVTKRAIVKENGKMFWIDCNIGSKTTMKYPSIILQEKGAYGEVESLAIAGKNQNQDTGAKIIHLAPNTNSNIISKSISKENGETNYRGLIKVKKGCKNVKSHIECDTLLLNEESVSNTYPILDIQEQNTEISHEATISKIGEDQLFYLMSRGLSKKQAISSIINGFATPIIKKLPIDYALEVNRLLEMETENSIG